MSRPGKPRDLTRRAIGAALAAAHQHGLSCDDPIVIRDLDNVLVHLRPAPVVARVATTTGNVRPGPATWLEREVSVATHLTQAGAPVVPPSSEIPPGPHTHDGLSLTFWKLVEHDPRRPLGGDSVGSSLRELHEAFEDYDGYLPDLRSVVKKTRDILARLAASHGLAAPDAALLNAALDRLAEKHARTGASSRPLHGDAHAGNALHTREGPLWADLEEACRGPVEWDLACLVADSRVFGTDEDVAQQALAAYSPAANEELLYSLFELRALQVAAWSVLITRSHPEKRNRAETRLRWWRERELGR